jgi:hypothetical protein
MNVRSILVSSAVLGLLAAGNAAAQKLALQIEQGMVTLEAENVTVDEVLARWSQTTGLNVVSKSGQGSDIPVSLHLDKVPEPEALRMLLRDLSGYIMGERRDPLTGLVTIDRLMILPQSAAVQPATAAAPPRGLQPFTRRPPAPAFIEPSVVPEAPQSAESDTPVELAPQPSTASTSPFGNSRGAARPGDMTPPLPVVAPPPQVPPSRTSDGPPVPPPSDDGLDSSAATPQPVVVPPALEP